ncbi:MAG: hypothetical protein P1S46_12355, partial [bacterium]|nr:hypothetical protein [bacterium]
IMFWLHKKAKTSIFVTKQTSFKQAMTDVPQNFHASGLFLSDLISQNLVPLAKSDKLLALSAESQWQ